MAKKKDEISMKDSLAEFKELKNIDKDTMITVLRDSFLNVLAKIYGTSENCNVIVNLDFGDFEISRTRIVVADDEVFDEVREIALSEARILDEEAEIGEEIAEAVDFNAFGRRAVINLRQALASKILDLQKENFYHKFEKRVGELVSVEVHQVWKRETLFMDSEGNELLMPKSEQIPSDFFRKGEMVRAVIERVENENNNPKVILSRVSGKFLLRLLEREVPEIANGLITVQAIARIPGERAKIAVESYDERIDPVGACVGINGARIRPIVRELKGENIDITTYTTNTLLFITRALSPAKVAAIALSEEDEEEKRAEVYLRPDQVPLAIGKNAYNLKLASLLTGYKIEVFRDNESEEEDIYLDEFSDEIDEWIIDILKTSGYTTARSVLKKSQDEILRATDLEEDTVAHVFEVLSSEFTPEELEAMRPKEHEDAQTSTEEPEQTLSEMPETTDAPEQEA